MRFLLIFLLSLINEAQLLSFPHIYSTGSHYQVFFDIGSTFKQNIHEYYKKHPLLHSKFLPWAETPYGKYILQGYINITQLQYEWIIDEIQGLADGSGKDFLEVFMMCYSMELSQLIGPEAVRNTPDSCSDAQIHLPNTSQIVMGHNEVTYSFVLELGFFVTAHIIEKDPSGRVVHEEKFTHYSYPGLLPGLAFGFNSYGLVQTINALYPDVVLTNKTGRYILTRVLLRAKSLGDVEQILYNEGYGAAYGVNINLGVLQPKGESGQVPEIWNIEVAPNVNANRSILDVYRTNTSYYHVNMYRRLKIKEVPEKIKSSEHRTKRILAHPIPSTTENIKSILGDTVDQDNPIFRRPRPTDPESTVATAIFDLSRRTMAVYKDNPSNSTMGPVMQLPLDMY